MVKKTEPYPATLDIDYPIKQSRWKTLLRLILALPILLILGLLTSTGSSESTEETSQYMSQSGGGIVLGLFVATALLILFRQRYPRWWFDFNLELNRFSTRVGAYILLLTDVYPSTEDAQSVHLNIAYPDAKKDLNRWLPLVKWILAFPHYVILFFLSFGVVAATLIAWVVILITGRYPQELFNFVVGVSRWGLRVGAYAFLLTTDKYPPFSLK
jgi:hypothetical protein